MSYCRWSPDSDLYCYPDVRGGWTTHVASRRRVRKPVSPSPYSVEALRTLLSGPKAKARRAWMAMEDAYYAELETIPVEPIGLPHDGESFNDATLLEFRARLQALREAGYRFPDYVLEVVDEELRGAAHEP